ncbi:hypothetical protein CHS0354_034802 [Potamilus streckersoni]|uniref:C2H2-type domain-containing protein n=1 Tax=Potamilus streckersoni TaxID=2493646 RepID=A0AAE0RT08_9BIVA|nr:hypothetical protein CHS0354_034802 [Potamilus streckersoni]
MEDNTEYETPRRKSQRILNRSEFYKINSGYTIKNKTLNQLKYDLISNETQLMSADSVCSVASDACEKNNNFGTVSDRTKSLILQKLSSNQPNGSSSDNDKVITVYTSDYSGSRTQEILSKTSANAGRQYFVVERIVDSGIQSGDSEISSNAASDRRLACGSDQTLALPNVAVSGQKTTVSCDDGPVSNTVVEDLQISNSASKEIYKCEECDYSSKNKHYLKQHVDLVHSSDRPYKCPFCDYAGKRSHALREHLIVHSNERPFECIHCNATFRKKGHLTNHIKLHTTHRLLKCPICKDLVSEAGDNGLDVHLRTVHNTEKVYGCDLCDYVAPSEQEIKGHIEIKHVDDLGYKCSVCNFLTKDRSHFEVHFKQHIMHLAASKSSLPKLPVAKPSSALLGQPTVIKPVWIKCSACGFTAHDAEVIREHMLNHISESVDKLQQSILTTENVNHNNTLEHTLQNTISSKNKIFELQTLSPSKVIDLANSKTSMLFKCGYCDFESTEGQSFMMHMSTHKQSKVRGSQTASSSNAALVKNIILSTKDHEQISCVGGCKPSSSLTSMTVSTTSMLTPVGNTSVEISNGVKMQATLENIIPNASRTLDKVNTLQNKYPPVSLVVSGGMAVQIDRETSTSSTLLSVKSDMSRQHVNSFQDLRSQSVRNQVETSRNKLFSESLQLSTKEDTDNKTSNQKQDKEKEKAVVYYITPVSKQNTVRNPTNVGFTHDSSAGRFRCTICGYTCEYQRTIKAHIWKHSGHKNIDYPMFQNGPLSIYEDTSLTRNEENKLEPVKNGSVVEFKVSEQRPPNQGNKSEAGETESVAASPIIVYEQSKISNVAPALAHLLAARAMVGMKESEIQKDDTTSNLSDDGHLKQIVSVLTPTSQNTCKVERDGDQLPGNRLPVKVDIIPESASLADISKRSLIVENNYSYWILASSRLNENKDGPSDGQSVQGRVLKRHSDELVQNVVSSESVKKVKFSELSHSPVNVVVESVDSVTAGEVYTGMRSQQGSPRLGYCKPQGEEVLESELSDSGVSSEVTVITTPHDESLNKLSSSNPFLKHVLDKNDSHIKVSNSVFVDNKEGDRSLTKRERRVRSQESARQKSDDVKGEERRPSTPDETAKKRTFSASSQESAVTLLSLLQKGPNYNPAYPLGWKTQQNTLVQPRGDKAIDESSEYLESTELTQKPKSGISSSLLAVIEQLRERSKSDIDDDVLSSVTRKGSKKRSRMNSVESMSVLDINNVEQVEVDGEMKYRCKLCHYMNDSTVLLRQHMRLHKTKQPFECSLCDFIAGSSEALQDHMIQHCKVRVYQCKMCPSAFNYKSQLRAHMRAHNEQEIQCCDSCDFETKSQSALHSHVKTHFFGKQHACDICKEEFPTAFNLRVHKREKSCMKNMRCSYCDFIATGTRELKNHLRIHEAVKMCSQCDYTTNNVIQLRHHYTEAHSEPKCELCGFTAVSVRSLKSHMKRHVNDQRFVQQPLEQYKCNLCGYVCHHLPSLKSHMWRHASNQNYSYEFTNEVINAAIDFDSVTEAQDTVEDDVTEFGKIIKNKLKNTCPRKSNDEPEPNAKICCWVTFRCCQCGFETINKAELNLHMRVHSDVIKFTLEVPAKPSLDQTRSPVSKRFCTRVSQQIREPT